MPERIDELTVEELQRKKLDLRKEMRELRFNMIVGQVGNPLRKRTARRTVARIETLLNEYKKGIRKPRGQGTAGGEAATKEGEK